VTVRAPAKVNLFLGVGPRRDDGFHPLATVYQAVGLHDVLSAGDADEVTVEVVSGAGLALDDVPTDATNIAVRAALLLAEHHGLERGARIVIDKGIPVAGGMAGGSADAAAALVACDALWGLRTPRRELLGLAARLGSDVPFALVGGTAVGSGHGELVTPLPGAGRYWWVALASPFGLSTPAVYREFDLMHDRSGPGDSAVPDRLLAALRAGDAAGLGAALGNHLQPAALRLRPELAEVLRAGVAASALAGIVSGSGPTCLFLCADRAHATRVADVLAGAGLGAASVVPGPVPGARLTAPVPAVGG
jgi:4-diphosphocytidyl-2-C-methyl-D-erythritol kinase